ncbi:MAG: hypothetical protein M3N43_02485, partial [Actinomycetota bacterium]|nr:hypothetical protein [Actinomycetota bacterium]
PTALAAAIEKGDEMTFRGRGVVLIAALVLSGTVACDSGDPLESAKATVCESAPGWQGTLEKVANADETDSALQTEVDELATGLDDAAVALTDAGAEAIAEAATSLGQSVDEIATALDSGAPEAAEKATAAATRLDALTTLAECGS